MKNIILLVALPFILGCTAIAQTTPSKQPKTNRVETFSQLDSTEPAERPNWLQIVPESNEGFYFVGMSTKRTEKRNARNESFNDAKSISVISSNSCRTSASISKSLPSKTENDPLIFLSTIKAQSWSRLIALSTFFFPAFDIH